VLTTDTVESLHRHLDAHPGDHQARWILADALEDVPGLECLADGYRALAASSLSPTNFEHSDLYPGFDGFWEWWRPLTGSPDELPEYWFNLVAPWRVYCDDNGVLLSKDFPTRREAEDAAALAFSKLPAARRTLLLAGSV